MPIARQVATFATADTIILTWARTACRPEGGFKCQLEKDFDASPRKPTVRKSGATCKPDLAVAGLAKRPGQSAGRKLDSGSRDGRKQRAVDELSRDPIRHAQASCRAAHRGIGAVCRTPFRASLRRRLLAWFNRHAHNLPWHRTRDPYHVWVSEIMLQQTVVAAVVPYFERFVARFPRSKTWPMLPKRMSCVCGRGSVTIAAPGNCTARRKSFAINFPVVFRAQ